MKTKMCVKCHRRRSVENDFPKLTGRSQGNTCNKCRTEYKKQWNRDHPEQAKASRDKTLAKPENLDRKRSYARKWHNKNAEHCVQKAKEWREVNRDRYNQSARDWRERNRDRLLDQKLRKEYGITIEDYHRMLTEQKHACAICWRPETPKKRLSVDHDHMTGKVRGLLCSRCNHALGLLQEDAVVIGRAASYLGGSHERQASVLHHEEPDLSHHQVVHG